MACGGRGEVNGKEDISTLCFFWRRSIRNYYTAIPYFEGKSADGEELKFPVKKEEMDPSLLGKTVMISTVYHVSRDNLRQADVYPAEYAETGYSLHLDRNCQFYLYVPSSNHSAYRRRFFCGNFNEKPRNFSWKELPIPPVNKYDVVVPCGVYYGRHVLVSYLELKYFYVLMVFEIKAIKVGIAFER